MKKIAVVLVSLVTALTSVPPAEAFPAINLEKPKVASNIEQIGDRDWSGWSNFARRRYIKSWRNNRGGYYGGNRGYRYNRYYGRRYHDYDNDNDAAAIIGGLALGAIVGGALAQPYYGAPSSYAYGGNGHTSWCYSRYRSYRAWDNTFQPYYGPRRQCVSPY
ncbi:BA14K-like protein [Rhizobium etli 8C-3]|uniref:Lectin-like protein BA14k n=2 Tax=Rhizobium TaxID=379 RepID=A0A4R3RP50_9HYPH|nr:MULTISPECIES: BA14K family protein [Rhizobium]APO76250.1 BA14K-like protein [Rhizobium etli 8C-3]TCU22355.1 BA14K-like protein [Rhizobium azibense]TCU35592.1 BA14K-like protein [Rhizobium azibense]